MFIEKSQNLQWRGLSWQSKVCWFEFWCCKRVLVRCRSSLIVSWVGRLCPVTPGSHCTLKVSQTWGDGVSRRLGGTQTWGVESKLVVRMSLHTMISCCKYLCRQESQLQLCYEYFPKISV